MFHRLAHSFGLTSGFIDHYNDVNGVRRLGVICGTCGDACGQHPRARPMSKSLDPFSAYLALKRSVKGVELGIRFREEGYDDAQIQKVADQLIRIHTKNTLETFGIQTV